MWLFPVLLLYCSRMICFCLWVFLGFFCKSKIKPELKHSFSWTKWTAERTVLQWTAVWIFTSVFLHSSIWSLNVLYWNSIQFISISKTSENTWSIFLKLQISFLSYHSHLNLWPIWNLLPCVAWGVGPISSFFYMVFTNHLLESPSIFHWSVISFSPILISCSRTLLLYS